MPSRPPTQCIVPGCDGVIAVQKHRLCWPHARRFYRHGTPGAALVRKVKARKPFVLAEKSR